MLTYLFNGPPLNPLQWEIVVDKKESEREREMDQDKQQLNAICKPRLDPGFEGGGGDIAIICVLYAME